MNFILAIDQGTTGTRSCLIDASNFSLIGQVSSEYPQIYPKPSWVEHNLNDIWSTVESTIKDLLKKHNVQGDMIKAIGITNQRETTCAFDKKGTPLANAIVWQDRRTSAFCQELRDKKLSEKIKEKTGLPIDPYFSATKMNWLLKNNQSVAQASSSKNLLFGTIDSFLLFKLSGNVSHKTDASNASRTMLMNLKTCDWDQELLEIFSVPRESLPSIEDSFGEFGVTKGLGFLPDGIPVTGILGDQQSALFGQAGFNEGEMKCTYGTGAFVLLNTGSNLIYSKSGLLTTVEYKHKGKAVYALEGSSYIAGAAVQWLRDNLKIIKKSSEIEPLAREVKNLDELRHIQFFPFFAGIGSPHWNAEAKGAITGLTRDSSRSHIAYACLEGVAMSINDLLTAMKNDTGLAIKTLKVDGGAASNSLLMELQATISETTIVRPKIIETTAFGAAMAAAIGAGMTDFEKLSDTWKKDREFPIEENLVSYIHAKKILWKKSVPQFFTN
ncbi:MAG: glycerol kinase GlpK [Bdellovibrionales bacterium]|nr:glycerol kinase GlpK [Bdellovibrionales bacterium]